MKIRTVLLGAYALAIAVALIGCGGEQTQTQADQSQSATPAQETQTMAKADMSAQDYPLDFCIVSGEKLGSMGDPVVKEYNGRSVKFCCNRCVRTFESDPAMYIAKIDSAAAGMAPAMHEGGMDGMEGHEGHDHDHNHGG